MQENKIKIGFASNPVYSGNAKALYEQLQKRKLEDYELIWFVKDEKQKEMLLNLNIKVISEKDDEFEEIFRKTEFMFITHDQYIDKKQENQTFISLYHGVGPKKSGYALEDCYERKFADKYGKLLDYICVPSEFAKMLFSYIFNIDNNKIIVAPYQRNRYIFESNGKKNIEKIIDISIKNYKKIIMYTPTFRKGIGKEEGDINRNNILGLKPYYEENLNEFLEKNNYLLVVKLHPSEEALIDENIIGKNVVILKDECMQKNNITINEILNGVDCLITDYSSIYTDYLLLEKPVIFIDTDLEKYSKKRGIYFNSEEFWYPGPIVNNIENFTKEIEKLLEEDDYYINERKKYNNLINGNENKDFNKFIDEFVLKLKSKYKISKIIHYLKKDKYTQKELENINEWKENLKDYEIKQWDLDSEEIKQIMENEKIEKENQTLIKLAILYKYGGVFIDSNIQLINSLEHLLIENDKIFIKDEYGNCIDLVIGASKNNEFIKECLNRKWFGINQDEEIDFYKKKDVFVSIEEQWRIGQEDFQDTDKYFNDTNITLKNKIRRALKYGFLMKK